ncbi:MAG: Methionyl-tRNA synthetase [Candidatus Woesebacteria bacterium GW2011_GWB1_39_10]|uniref:methionine--tRNA ligase n=3 Tax=Candidatus Woeseibacteriota TaxID=1752722 RepID=A0A0G0LVW6_9BACT|nr:MAG: Methionyl-tRNA synthetase [Candidatus Woesebacteria bacterium GW2011_GWB1_39_10]KKS91100.1 MAG: Methionyl-tRNA synthetase [Candidatus Woesebacteria bacterium GW2011_GWA1_43_12]
MIDKKSVYITTTLPYVNSDPHLGFALEITQADTVARFKRQEGFDVFFNFGTDEHGLKIYQKALEQGKETQTYVDEYAEKFDALKKALNLSYNNFIRTTDPHHIMAARGFWERCDKNGDIYKKNYKQKYCVGCELEKTDSELIENKCPLHPNRDIEIIEEENYFFKFSKYQQPLLEFYKKNPDFVVPDGKFSEIRSFVEGGLQDFSISRIKNKMPWGIPVPNDPEHVMFVWFDALVNYVSAIGWPDDMKKFDKWWPVVQFAGKDNLRQQTATWQAMLMSAGISNSKQIFIHGFITVNGQKISKSLGNTINPIDVVKKYGTDPVRYYLLSKINPYDDSDFTFEKFEDVYNGDLANGLGNLVSRCAKLCENSSFDFPYDISIYHILDKKIEVSLNDYRFDEALKIVWTKVAETDKYINENEPWKLEGDKLKGVLSSSVESIRHIAYNLKSFLPETAEKIEAQFKGPKIKSDRSLFPRLP